MKIIIISPVLDISFPDQIHGTDQLHSFEIGTVKFRHHRLNLRSVKHSHKNGLDHIIVVMPKCYLVASQFFRLAVKISSSHAGTEITRRFFNIVDSIKDLCLKNRDRDSQELCIMLDYGTVRFIITRIHHKEYQFKRKLVVTF